MNVPEDNLNLSNCFYTSQNYDGNTLQSNQFMCFGKH